MKKLLLPFMALLFLISCEKEDSMELISEIGINENVHITARSSDKRDVCHNGKLISINVNAISAHQAHGDAVDMDGDGFFDKENDCGKPVDCDDTVYDLENLCCEGYEIESNGTLFVALEDEPGLYTWQEALDACAAKSNADGCGWYLPNKEELNAIHMAKDEIGGFTAGVYLSADEAIGDPFDRTWTQHFNTTFDGSQVKVTKVVPGPCRCVRR